MRVRAVYDCMIFLQAAANSKRVHATFALVHSGAVTLCISEEIMAEVRDVLTRPRHQQKFPALTAEHVSEFLHEVVGKSTLIENVADTYTVARDPKDSPYVNLAIAASAAFIVSWDRHLLGLMDPSSAEGFDFQARFPSIQVVDPITFITAVDNRQ